MGAVLKLRVDDGLDVIARDDPVPPGVTAGTLANQPDDIQNLPGGLRDLVEGALAHGVAAAFLAVVPVAIIAAVVAWWLPELALRDSGGIGTHAQQAGTDQAMPSSLAH